MKTKKCSTCGKSDGDVQFYKKSYRCKSCHKKYSRERYRINNKVTNTRCNYPESDLKKLYIKLGMTHKQLAEKLGDHASNISLYLIGKKEIPNLQAILVQELLND